MALHLPQPHHAGGEHGSGHRPHRRRHAHPARGGVLDRGAAAPGRPATGCSRPRSASAWPSGRSGCRLLQRRLPKERVFTGVPAPGRVRCCSGRQRRLDSGWPRVRRAHGHGRRAGLRDGLRAVAGRRSTTSCGAACSARSTPSCACACCVSMVAGPLLAALLGGLSEDWLGGSIERRRRRRGLPGVRLTLWLAGADHHRRRASWRCTRCGRGSGRRRTGRHASVAAPRRRLRPQLAEAGA